jgi:hypothetical protein
MIIADLNSKKKFVLAGIANLGNMLVDYFDAKTAEELSLGN